MENQNIVSEEKLTGHRITVKGPTYNESFWVYGDFNLGDLREFFLAQRRNNETRRRRTRTETPEPVAA